MKIRELLKDQSCWIQGRLAIDMNGCETSAESLDACKWCLIGALYKCYSNPDERISIKDKIRDKTQFYSVVFYNDRPERTFKDIQRLVDELDI